jgi:hypothetical protein
MSSGYSYANAAASAGVVYASESVFFRGSDFGPTTPALLDAGIAATACYLASWALGGQATPTVTQMATQSAAEGGLTFAGIYLRQLFLTGQVKIMEAATLGAVSGISSYALLSMSV